MAFPTPNLATLRSLGRPTVIRRLAPLLLGLISLHHARAGVLEKNTFPITWPPGVESRIEQILAMKAGAMTLDDMRYRPPSEPGAAHPYERLFDEIAVSLLREDFRPSLEKYEGRDIRAKIALWALDRRQRGELYKQVTHDYVNRPPREEWGAYEAKKFTDPDRVESAMRTTFPTSGITANPVGENDIQESMRLPLEYAYFSPATGAPFTASSSWWRANLYSGLKRLSDGRSQVIFTAEAEAVKQVMRILNHPGDLPPASSKNVVAANARTTIWALTTTASLENYLLLVDLDVTPQMAANIRESLSDPLREYFEVEADRTRSYFNDWRTVALDAKDVPVRGELAKFILTLKLPEAPPGRPGI